MNYSTSTTNQNLSEEELTTREQILRAATRQFADYGFRGASIRGIASAAEVSAGLVQHHFGTKDGLRQACDDRVLGLLKDSRELFLQRGMPSHFEEAAAKIDELSPVVDYLIMSLSSGSQTAAHWFREVTEYTHGTLTSGQLGSALDPETQDTQMIAATQTAMALGITAFYRTIQQALEIEDEAELVVRVGHARLFLAPDRLIGQEVRQYLASMLDEYEQRTATGNRTSNDDEAPSEP